MPFPKLAIAAVVLLAGGAGIATYAGRCGGLCGAFGSESSALAGPDAGAHAGAPLVCPTSGTSGGAEFGCPATGAAGAAVGGAGIAAAPTGTPSAAKGCCPEPCETPCESPEDPRCEGDACAPEESAEAPEECSDGACTPPSLE